MNCELCGRGEDRIKRFIKHHLSYEPEVLATLCWGCHARLHGTGRCFHDPFVVKYGKDKGPLEFAKRVVKMYRRTK